MEKVIAKFLYKISVNKWLIIACFLAFIVRLALIFFNPRGAMLEDWGLFDLARSLVQGRGYGLEGPDGNFISMWVYPPGPSALLAGIYLLFGIGAQNFIQLRILESIIDSLSCILIFLIAKELFNRKIGLISAFLYATFLPIAFMSTWPAHDALMPFLTLVSLYFFVMGVRRKAVKFYILSAITVGISCYFQPTTTFLPLMFGLGLLIYNFHKSNFKRNVINAAKITAIMMVVFGLTISPWLIRNYNLTGTLTPMRSAMWATIYQGFAEFGENPVGAVLNDWIELDKASKELGHELVFASKEYEDYYRGKVISTIKEYPGWWLSILTKRVPRTIIYPSILGINYYPRDANGNLLLDEYNRRYPHITVLINKVKEGTFWEFARSYPYSIFSTTIIALFGVIPVLLSVVGIWVARRNWRKLVLVATVPAYFSMMAVFIMAVNAKNKIPGSSGYLIFSAIALYYIYCKVRGKDAEEIILPPP